MIVISMCQSVNDGHELWASPTEIITSDYCYNQSSGRQKIKQNFSCNHEEEESPTGPATGSCHRFIGAR